MVHTSGSGTAPPPGARHYNLKRSFKLGVRSLLTAFSKEDVCKAFPTLSNLEKERLHRMFIQVIKSLHGNIEVQGEWQVRAPHLTDLCNEAKELKSQFDSCQFCPVGRESNYDADREANRAVNLRGGEVYDSSASD